MQKEKVFLLSYFKVESVALGKVSPTSILDFTFDLTKPGIPNLSLTMYPFSIPKDKHVPFSISTDEHVPLKFLKTKYFIMINQLYLKNKHRTAF